MVAVATAMETATAGTAKTAAGASTTALGIGADFLFCPQMSSRVTIILDTFLVFVQLQVMFVSAS
jgi:hypothetical protein